MYLCMHVRTYLVRTSSFTDVYTHDHFSETVILHKMASSSSEMSL